MFACGVNRVISTEEHNKIAEIPLECKVLIHSPYRKRIRSWDSPSSQAGPVSVFWDIKMFFIVKVKSSAAGNGVSMEQPAEEWICVFLMCSSGFGQNTRISLLSLSFSTKCILLLILTSPGSDYVGMSHAYKQFSFLCAQCRDLLW